MRRYSILDSTWGQLPAEVIRQNHNLGPVYLDNTWCKKVAGMYLPERIQPALSFRVGDEWVDPKGVKHLVEKIEKNIAFLRNVNNKHLTRKDKFTPMKFLPEFGVEKQTRPIWTRTLQGPVPGSVRQPKEGRGRVTRERQYLR